MTRKRGSAVLRVNMRSFCKNYSLSDPNRGPFGDPQRIIWAAVILVSGCAVAAVQGANVEAVFDSVARANPEFAISTSYVMNDDDPVVMTAGPTRKDGSIMVANDARWHLGSIGKSFTATLIMRLVQQGLLDLDAPIATHLPAYRDTMHPDWQAATLRRLLSHTSGIPPNASRLMMLRTWDEAPYAGRRAILSAMWDKPLRRNAGDFRYSNLGYVMAGVIAEEVTQSSWEDLILSEIAAPLGLTSLGFGPPTQAEAPWGHGSLLGLGLKRPADPANIRSDNPRWMGPAGTIHLNMAELAKWGQVHIQACQGRLPNFLTQANCQTMQTPVSENYGLGWVIQTAENGERLIWHNGSNTKWYAELAVFPEQEIVVAAATNVFAARRVHGLALGISDRLVDDRQ